MAVVADDVVAYSIILGNLDSSDATLVARVELVTDMMIAKVYSYLGYEVPDELKNVIAEMVIVQLKRYSDLQNDEVLTKRITRGDYTVEYDTNIPTDIFNSYEWLLKKYKKLKTI